MARRVARGTLGAYYLQPLWGRVAQSNEEMDGLLDKLAGKEGLYLHDFWASRQTRIKQKALRCSIVDIPTGENIAIGSSATQSSISPWSKGKTLEEDAKHAVSGIVTGGDGFHTDLKDSPWWMTDLHRERDLVEIRVFNSLKNVGMAARAYPLVVESSSDGVSWSKLFENFGCSPFGGADGHPLTIRKSMRTRYVRLRLTLGISSTSTKSRFTKRRM